MRRLSSTTLTVVFTGLVSLSALTVPFELASNIYFQRVKDSLEFDISTSNQTAIHETLATASRASNALFPAPDSSFYEGMLYARLSEGRMSIDQKIKNLCKSLAAYGQAVSQDPMNSRAITRWASLRQVLGDYSCQLPLTAGDPVTAVKFAQESAPNDPRIQYLAGKVLLWTKDRTQALAAFRNSLNFDGQLQNNQKDYIVSLIRDSSDIEALIPRRFPQAYEWSRKIKSERPDKYEEAFDSFSMIQRAAVIESAQAYDNNLIPADIHLERLAALRSLRVGDSVLTVINAELARVFGSGKLGGNAPDVKRRDYFEAISHLHRMPAVFAALAADTRPNKTSLSNWGFIGYVKFDSFFHSIGLFLNTPELVRFVELQAPNCTDKNIINNLKIFKSRNNESWEQPLAEPPREFIELEDQCLIRITLDQSNYHYWKFNYSSSHGEGTFANNLLDLVTVYALQ